MNEKTSTLFNKYLDHAVKFHGHLCGGQVLGVRMAMAGLRELDIEDHEVVERRGGALERLQSGRGPGDDYLRSVARRRERRPAG